MTAIARAHAHAVDTCHWCPNLWFVAVDDQAGTTWHACPEHTHLLPPWNSEENAA